MEAMLWAVTDQPAFTRWLRAEMARKGYPVGSPRAGGIARLAADTGIGQASISRLVNGQAVPSIDILRKLGDIFGRNLAEMMVAAGQADPQDLRLADQGNAAEAQSAPVPSAEDKPWAQEPADYIGAEPWDELSDTDRHLWLTPDLTPVERLAVVRFVRALTTPESRESLRRASEIHDAG
jgi:transcriptional regulator with XRE-family HTH domain